MFTITPQEDTIRVQSSTSTLEIVPKAGAILNRWQVSLNGRWWEAIEGYESYKDFTNNCEAKGFRSCKLSPYVCRIANEGKWQFEGNDYNIGKFNLAGAMLHGLLYNEPFEISYSEATETYAMVALQHHYQATDPGFPFPYFVEVVYYLLPGNSVKISTSIFNQGTNAMPIADGWHPYFSLGRPIDELYLEMASDKMLVFDDKLIPTGDLKNDSRFEFMHTLEGVSLDNCFLLHKPLLGSACSLVNTQDKIALHVTPDENYPYLQLYTPPHRNSIAIENLSAAPNAFNNKMGLIILEPDEQAQFSTTFQLAEWL